MADFKSSFVKGIKLEGGFKLTDVPGDNGGITYAGISKNKHPDWAGWDKMDNNKQDVESFYKTNFWDKILGDNIRSQTIADIIYLSSMNMGLRPVIKIIQKIVKCTQDGLFGRITLGKLNDLIHDEKDEKIFILTFNLLIIFRYKNICLHDKRRKRDKIVSNEKFLCGWINRIQKTVII